MLLKIVFSLVKNPFILFVLYSLILIVGTSSFTFYSLTKNGIHYRNQLCFINEAHNNLERFTKHLWQK